jgi:hypothetical protein
MALNLRKWSLLSIKVKHIEHELLVDMIQSLKDDLKVIQGYSDIPNNLRIYGTLNDRKQ